MNAETTAQRVQNSSGSLERKLVLSQFGRGFFLIISVDIWIILLFLTGLLVYGERTAKTLLQNPGAPRSGFNYIVEQSGGDQPGWTLAPQIARRTGQENVVRNLWVEGEFDGNPVQALQNLRYSVSFPSGEPGEPFYTRVTFSFHETVVIFSYALAVLLAVEIIGLISNILKFRKTVRRALRPIYDLTMMAQSVNRNTALPLSEELHLSGAIDTLNTITENDLDRRIVIIDERQELRGLAQAINSMLDRLDAAYRSQLRFVSDASHELRTPISVIQGYANLLDRWGKNDQVTLQESIDAIKVEAASMQSLVEQLLFLARSDNRSIVLNIESVDLRALAGEVLRETQMIDPSHEYCSNLEDGLRVRGDSQLLKQAMRIFVDNAIKYTPAGGKITISVFRDNGCAKLSVSDNGAGIAAEDLERVFDRFFRADASRTRGTGGTGLGLSIAKWIIDRHGGFVEILSREDIGTKVTVVLPQSGAEPLPEAVKE